MPSSKAIRFAVVGVKGYSRSHLQLVQMLAEQGRGQLAASMMVDRAEHPELVSTFESQGVHVYDDYATMLDASKGQVDAVTLPVPIYLHASMAIAALRAGYHVLVEKPVAGSLSEVDAMIAARNASGKQCAVGFQQIYSPMFQSLKQRIVAGNLGKVQRLSIMALWPRNPAYYARNEWAGKLFCRGQPVYDSPFNNALAHQIMNMLYLASPRPQQAAQVARVEGELYRAYDIESFDTGCMRAQTEDGAEIVFAATHACQVTVQPTMKLKAERARVNWHIGGNATITYDDGTVEVIREDTPREHMAHNVADAFSSTVPAPLCTLEIGRAHVACIRTLHDTASIQTVPARFVTQIEGGQRVLDHVLGAVQGTFETGRLFSELDIPFAGIH